MNPDILLAGLQKKQQESENQALAKEAEERQFASDQFQKLITSHAKDTKEIIRYISSIDHTVSVDNFPEYPTFDASEVVQAIKDSVADPTDTSKIEAGLQAIEKQQKALADLFAKFKLDPKINVAAPVVQVDAPDLTSLEQAIKDAKPEPVTIDFSGLTKLLQDNIKSTESVKKAINSLVFPVSNTPTDPLIKYSEADIDDVDGAGALKTIRYYGYTDNSGAWYIKRYDGTNAGTTGKTIRFSFGQSNYAAAWTGRAGLTYTVWGS